MLAEKNHEPIYGVRAFYPAGGGQDGALGALQPEGTSAMPRIIYSLHLDCGRQPAGNIIGFVVPLDRTGIDPDIIPIGKARVVDLRVGDWFVHRPSGKRCKLAGIVAY